MPDSAVEGPIAYADSDTLEANLQPFDPATGAVVDDTFDELFTSPFAGNGATSRTFGPNARPVVTDVNGDGLFDLVILYDGGYAVYLNGGEPDVHARGGRFDERARPRAGLARGAGRPDARPERRA